MVKLYILLVLPMSPVAYSNTFMNNMLIYYNNRLVCCINIHYITFVACEALSVTVLYCIHITKESTTVSNFSFLWYKTPHWFAAWKIWICIQVDDCLIYEKVPRNQWNMQSWFTGFAWITEVIEKLLSKPLLTFRMQFCSLAGRAVSRDYWKVCYSQEKGYISHAALIQLDMHLFFFDIIQLV